ncbi:hypothetical protein AAAC13_01185 [Pseudomonas aeruginosa]
MFVQETEMPAEVAELYQDSQQPTYEQYYEWQMAADQGAGEREEAAVVATLIADHDAFSHVPVGYWRHPLSAGASHRRHPFKPWVLTPRGRPGRQCGWSYHWLKQRET